MKSRMPMGTKTARKMMARLVTGEALKSKMYLLVRSKSLSIRRTIQPNLQVRKVVKMENSLRKRAQTKSKKKLNILNDKIRLLTTIKLSSFKRMKHMALVNQNRLKTSQRLSLKSVSKSTTVRSNRVSKRWKPCKSIF